ncbi:MerR family transcriptional regulator [Pediococcus argentinicus]|uniref:HTH merR-type domain-containing protein n=1 Tax=Pediococcus argentinicus TaxID=480391 RepID=A0A0R2N4S2_9LACO|nr:MerR family transcriptional regulator [Pediococcus argentinicus]KRO20156.1 hypothetical protein IV88_GL001648 [Pediococcus argentinicus]NKZ23199.1 MerR family transcriptional regulator [Pediococcus argentinicus]GEP20410.1 MerR family transcriptional regulator [Pediococcus argentinicus]
MTTIQEVADMLKVTPNTIRYYEKMGVIDHIARDRNGVRQFNNDNIERTHMAIILRNMGMPVKEVREQMHQTSDDPTVEELNNFKDTISSLLVNLDEKAAEIEQEKIHVKQKLIILDEQIRRRKIKEMETY